MRDSFAIDKEKLYGFDYDNHMAMAWALEQDGEDEVFREAASEEVAAELAEQAEIVKMVEEVEAVEEISAKDAFFEFARGPQAQQQAQPAHMPIPPIGHPPVRPVPPIAPIPPIAHPPHRPIPPIAHPPIRPVPPIAPIPPHRPVPPIHPPNINFDPNSGSAPRFAPPAYIPQRAPGLRAVDPGAISRCLYSNTYVWLNNRQEFWFFPTFIGRRSIAGFRWMNRRWVYMGFSLNMIDSFFCGGR